jgi:hypothetical protein
MNKTSISCIILLIFTGMVLAAGCSKYADPELDITSTLTKVSEEPASGNITYSVSVTVSNTGENNAYQVKVLAILSTPKDLPEYRFTAETIGVGEVRSGQQETFTRQMVLPATRANYDLIISGSRNPDIETKITSVTSSVMG